MKQNLTALLLFLAWATGFATPAVAQDYPVRPVKMIVGTVPGGGIDIMARTLAGLLSEALGQQFVVENKAGAGGALAAAFVANAQPDGYTLLVGETSQLEIAPSVMQSLPYDPAKDLTPIGLITKTGLILVANPQTSIKTLDDLLREARRNPGKLTYGSSGIGGIHHFSGEIFQRVAGIELTHVPYKGSGQSIQAVLSGEVDLCMTSMTAAKSFIETNRLNLLATTSKAPLPGRAEIPSISTVAKDYDYSVENGLLGPAGLPHPIVAKLSDAVRKAVSSADFARFIQRTPGTVASWLSAEDYAANMARNAKKFADATKVLGIKPQSEP